MQHKAIRLWLAAGGMGIFLVFMGFLAKQTASAQTVHPQPKFQGADLSNAILRLEDLPAGFEPLSGSDLERMESAIGSIGEQLAGTYNLSLVNFTGFRTTDLRNPQFIVSGLITPLSPQVQSDIDRSLANPDLVIHELQDQLGGEDTSELSGYEGIGNSSIGFIANTMGFRMEYVVARRGPVMIEIANLYREGEQPIANTIELARILDGRVADVVGWDEGTAFRPAGPYVPELTTYIPTPLDVSTQPEVVGSNLLLAALLMLPFAVAAELFTRTLGEHEDALQRIQPIGWLINLQKRFGGTRAGLADTRSASRNASKLIGVMVFYGIVFSLLDRTWNPFSAQGAILFLSMTIAYGVIGIADDILQWRAIRKWGLSADLSVRLSNFLLAMASTATSRLLSLVPGLMFGTPEALRTEESQFDEPKRDSLLKLSATTFTLIGLGVWLSTIFTALLQRLDLTENALNLIGGLEGFLLVIFAVALENLFVQMLGFPGGFGQTFKRRNKWGWLAALTGVAFLFYHTLINPRGELAEALQRANIWLFFGIALAFVVFAFGLHLSLHRPKRESPDPFAKVEAVAAKPAPAPYAPPTPVSMEVQAKKTLVPINESKQCPVCCNHIKSEARICRYCKATFTVAIRGYCTTDQAVVEVSAEGKCPRCGDELVDVNVESRLLKAPEVIPIQAAGTAVAHPVSAPAKTDATDDTKICPVCGKTIKAEARLCRFCRTTFQIEPKSKEETKVCPSCGKTIKAEARLCRFCRARFDVGTDAGVQSHPAESATPKPSVAPIETVADSVSVRKALVVDDDLIDEMVSLMRTIDVEARKSTTPSEKWKVCEARLREIGEQLFDAGGEGLMKTVYALVYQKGRFSGRYLEHVWDRVGTWLG